MTHSAFVNFTVCDQFKREIFRQALEIFRPLNKFKNSPDKNELFVEVVGPLAITGFITDCRVFSPRKSKAYFFAQRTTFRYFSQKIYLIARNLESV